MLLAYSCPMRWKIRSPPERSTRRAMPGYFASNAFPTRSATGRSTAVYQTTLPSFFAASTSSGVTLVGAGAAAWALPRGATRTRETVSTCTMCRTQMLPLCIDVSSSGYQRSAPFGRQREPHRSARCERVPGRGGDAQLRAVSGFDQVIAGVAEEYVTDDRALDSIGGRRGGRQGRD